MNPNQLQQRMDGTILSKYKIFTANEMILQVSEIHGNHKWHIGRQIKDNAQFLYRFPGVNLK